MPGQASVWLAFGREVVGVPLRGETRLLTPVNTPDLSTNSSILQPAMPRLTVQLHLGFGVVLRRAGGAFEGSAHLAWRFRNWRSPCSVDRLVAPEGPTEAERSSAFRAVPRTFRDRPMNGVRPIHLVRWQLRHLQRPVEASRVIHERLPSLAHHAQDDNRAVNRAGRIDKAGRMSIRAGYPRAGRIYKQGDTE